MASTFFGLNIGLQGLYASRTALYVAGNNLANLNTEGYCKQVADMKATPPMLLKNGKGMLGTGSEVTTIRQLRDSYLDKKYWSQSSIYGENRVKNSSLQQIDSIFNSVSDKSYNNVSNGFFDSLQDVSKVASTPDETHLTVLKQSGITYAQYFNDAAQKLKSEQDTLNFNIKATVDQINTLATQIQSLNAQIWNLETDGSNANSLRDERALLIDNLSSLVNVEVSETAEGKLRIDLNGEDFINHLNVRTLEVKQRDTKLKTVDEFFEDSELCANYGINKTPADGTAPPAVDSDEVKEAYQKYQEDLKKYKQKNVDGLYDVYWEGGKKLDTSDYGLRGQLKGYIEMRDGNNNSTDGAKAGVTDSINYKGVPYYMEQLNYFVRNFARLMNEGKSYDDKQLAPNGGFANGYGLNDESGIGFFSYSENGKNISAKFVKEADGSFKQDEAGNYFIKDEAGNEKVFSYDDITASNFSISKEVNDNIKNIATRFKEMTGESDNNLISDIINLRNDNGAFSQGKIDDFMGGLFTDIAVSQEEANTYEKSQKNIVLTITNQRLSVSGVSENEEMSDFVRYQQIYTACAKMISVMDEIYDVTINKLGTT